MDGEVQKAAELYLQVKEKTTNGIVWMEMDRFFRGYKSEILKSCEELIANHNKKEALALMELWSRLIPEDDDIQGALYLAKTVCARTQSEIEKEIGEIRAVIGTQMITPVSVEKNPGKSRKQIKSDRTSDETSADDVNKKVSDPSAETEEVKAPADIQVKVSEEHKMYRKALTRAWKRLGYSDELAELRTQIICTGEESELEWLAEQVRNRQFRREEKACAYKLVGDVRMKQGQTREAFANYKKALEYEMPSYVRTELYRIFINDLRFSRYDCNIVGSQLRFHSQHQFTHYLTFTSYYLRQIERDFRDIDCILRCMFCTVISLCRIQQCFRRNTAFVQTDATQTILFDKQYAQTAFTGSFGSRISRRTATDDNHLIFHSI